MSYDASSLRGSLQRIDGSAPSIQGAAASMMKHYDKSPGVAVNCWRDMLARARSDQFLPLLYVANEVLQNSKRNRGNRFLEAFSPVLGQSLIYVCGKSAPQMVESIRRTVKIWAERRVFSIRYVNELLKGLEPYRAGGGRTSSSSLSSSSLSSSSNRLGPPVFPGNEEENDNDHNGDNDNAGGSSPGGSRFSPGPEPPQESRGSHAFGNERNSNTTTNSNNNNNNNNNNDDDDDDNMFGGEPMTTNGNDDDDESDDDDVDDLFGNATTKMLQVDVDFDRASATSQHQQPSKSNSSNSNNSNSNNSNNSNPNNKRRRSRTFDKQNVKRTQFLSTSTLLELMNKVSDATRGHESVLSELGDLRKQYSNGDNDGNDGNNDNNGNNDNDNSNSIDDATIASLVGDELLAAYRKTLRDEEQLLRCRRRLRSIAETKRGLELEALRYLPWLERALKQDGDDLALYGGTYQNQLVAFGAVHEPTKRARDQRLAAEALRLRKEEEEQRMKREEEDRKKFMESAMSKQTEAQPGMVWNRATGEYQHLNQEESWRD